MAIAAEHAWGFAMTECEKTRRARGTPGMIRRGARKFQPNFETVEPRTLLTGSVSTIAFPIPSAGVNPQAIEFDADGTPWFAMPNSIGRIDLATGRVTEFSLPCPNSGFIVDLTAAPDGKLWFAETNAGILGSFDPKTRAVQEFTVPLQHKPPGAGLNAIAFGPDGNLWFTSSFGLVGMLDPESHAITVLKLSTTIMGAYGITAGPDGNMWFAEHDALYENDRIGEVDLATHVISEFPVPTQGARLETITSGADGAIWFDEIIPNQVGSIDPVTHVIKEFPTNVPGGGFQSITPGPDGELWLAGGSDQVARFDPTTHAVTTLSLDFGDTKFRSIDIVPGPDGDLWCAELNEHDRSPQALASIDPTTQKITQHTISSYAMPLYISGGPDGRVWFTNSADSRIGVIDPISGASAEFTTLTPDASPTGLTSGPDGRAWFVENLGNRVGAIDPVTDAVSEFAIPTAASGPRAIAAGPNGKVWFTETDANQIGIIDPSTGAIDEYPIPTPGAAPAAITAGSDGRLWFLETGANQIGAIDPKTHTISEFAVPDSFGLLSGIAAGGDGRIWFPEQADRKLGAIDPTTHLITSLDLPVFGDIPFQLTVRQNGNVWFTAGGNRIGEVDVTTEEVSEFEGTPANSGFGGIAAGSDGNLWLTDGAESQLVVAILPTPTHVVLSADNPKLVRGQAVTLTAKLTPDSPFVRIPPSGVVTFLDGTLELGKGTISVVDGVATATLTTSFAVGTHSITAVYAGDVGDFASTSPAVGLNVGKDDTTTVLSVSSNPAIFGQAETITATVCVSSPGAGTPGGSVTFKDGATVLGTATLATAAGVTTASFGTSALAVGAHAITAVYEGDASDLTSSTDKLDLSVKQAETATLLAASVSPVSFGETETLTATVSVASPGAGTPTGTVTFKEGDITLGTADVSSVGGIATATFTTSALAPGTHVIIALYGGDANDASSTSAASSVKVVQSTAIALAASSNPAVRGQSEQFTATVTGVSGTIKPSGSVTFLDGVLTLGAGTLGEVDGGIEATFSIALLSVGIHKIKAVYNGDDNSLASMSEILTLTVGPDATVTSVVASASKNVFGQSVTFTTTVSIADPGAGVPSGSVTFKDGSTVLGMGTLSSNAGVMSASLSTSSLSVGDHAIAAVYSGDDDDLGSSSAPLSFSVEPAATTSSVATARAVFGEPTTLTAAVMVSSPGKAVPTGMVTFRDGDTTLGTALLNTLGGATTATFSTASLSVGVHMVTAVYGGDANDLGSTSAATALTIFKDATATAIVPSSSPVVFGQLQTITATVKVNQPGAGKPTGTVTFLEDKAVLGSVALADVGGIATAAWTTATLSVGSHAIAAVYDGDANDVGSNSAASTFVVARDSTAITLVAGSSSLFPGQHMVLTATVRAVPPGKGSPTGSVTFTDGSTPLGTAALATVDGVSSATLTVTAGSLGTHAITAVYSGDGNDDASSSETFSLQVVQSSTTTAVTTSVSRPVFGQAVTLTATEVALDPRAGNPTGTVKFLDGARVLGTATLHTTQGKTSAVLTTHAMAAGTHAIKVVYGGTAVFLGSTSKPLSLSVARARSRVSVSASPAPGRTGHTEAFTATVLIASPGSGIPAGTVMFKDGSRVLGTVSLRAVKGVATATLTTSKLKAGKHSITVVYSGGKNVLGSTSSSLSLNVSAQATHKPSTQRTDMRGG